MSYLKWIILDRNEWYHGKAILKGAEELLASVAKRQWEVLPLAEVQERMDCEKQKPDCFREYLLLTTRDQNIEWAREHKIAVVAFLNPSFAGQERMGCGYLLESLVHVDADDLEKYWQRCWNLPWHILSTPRLWVREFTLDDLDDLYELYGKPGMTEYMEPLYDREKEEAYQRAYIENMYGFYGYGMWLVYEKESGKLVGRAGLENREYQGEWYLEMGYAIATECQRRGFATEVCNGILQYARENLEYEEVNCLIRPENVASMALVNKLGFQYRKTVMIEGNTYDWYARHL